MLQADRVRAGRVTESGKVKMWPSPAPLISKDKQALILRECADAARFIYRAMACVESDELQRLVEGHLDLADVCERAARQLRERQS